MAGQIISKIAAGGGTHLVSSSFYGTCETPQETAAKIAKLADANIDTFKEVVGMLVSIKFTAANIVANPTLTLQTSGGTQLFAAKSIMRYGTTAPNTSAASGWNPGSVVNLVWDGTYWQMVGWINNNDNNIPSVFCGSPGSTAAKTGSLTASSWSGLTGSRYLVVNMNYDNSAASALTLNVAYQGDKPIYINGTTSSSSNHTLPRGTYIVYYDGTNFHFRTDGKIPKLIDSGSLTTSSIGSASAGTAIPADDITAWTTNTPTAVTKQTVIKTLTSTTLTVNNGNLIIPESILTAFTSGDSVSVTAGTAASLSYTAKSIPNISVTSKTVVTGDVD